MLRKIIDYPHLKRLDNIIQWQEFDTFTKESVSQHSYKVAIFARILLEDIFGDYSSKEVLKFKLEVVTRALLHDWDEALLLRDISHETKYNGYNGTELRRVLDDFSAYKSVEDFWSEYKGEEGTSRMLINNIQGKPEPVYSFVKICDWIALYFYMKRERDLGNHNLDHSWNIARENFVRYIDYTIKLLNEKFENEEKDYTELLNLKTLFNYE